MAIVVSTTGAFIATKASATTSLASNTFTSSSAIGDLILVGVACDNAGASGAASLTGVTDSQGNTYTALGPGIVNRTAASAANDGCTVALFGSTLTTALTSSDTFTVNFSPATTAKVANCLRVTGAGAVFNSNSATGSGATWSTGGPSASLAVGELLVAYHATESTGVDSAPTGSTGGTWVATTASQTAGSGGDATKMSGAFAYKIITGAGTQNATAATSVSTDWAGVYVCFRVGTGAQTIGPATGVTVTTTPGTPAFAIDQTLGPATGPTVTATPGIAAVIPDQQIAGVTGPTVTVTPGTGTIAQLVEASAFLGVADTAGDFATMTTATAALYVAEAGTATDDTLDLYAQVFAADETTPLTDEELVYSHGDTPGLVNVTFSGVVAGDKTTWDAARLRLRWVNLRVGTDDLLDVRVHAVELGGTYATGALTVSPTGPTVTVTPGTPAVALAITPTGATVTVTAGTGTVSLSGGPQTITPTGATVTITAGTPTFGLNLGPTVGVTVTVTPGIPTVTPGVRNIGPATGPTVTITPGTPSFARTLGPVSGVTVTVTPGTPAFAIGSGQNVQPVGVTVTVTPGTGNVAAGQTVTPTGPTVTITPGTPAFARRITPTGVTVTVTPGTGTVLRHQAIVAAGVTVTVTAGVPMLAALQTVTLTGPTVTVTPGVLTIVHDPQQDRERFVARIPDADDLVGLLVGTPWEPHLVHHPEIGWWNG